MTLQVLDSLPNVKFDGLSDRFSRTSLTSVLGGLGLAEVHGPKLPKPDLSKISCAMPRQDLDQITTFSEIMDSLKNFPTEQESKEINNFNRSKDMTYMAPLGPSQVDIGNLSCR